MCVYLRVSTVCVSAAVSYKSLMDIHTLAYAGRHHVEIVGEQDAYENWHEWDSLLDENPSHIDACDDE